MFPKVVVSLSMSLKVEHFRIGRFGWSSPATMGNILSKPRVDFYLCRLYTWFLVVQTTNTVRSMFGLFPFEILPY